MKRMLGIAAVAAVLVLPLRPLTAHASSAGDCQAQITALRAATDAVTFPDSKQGDKTKSQMLFHLDKATRALGLGNYVDASAQLDNYLGNLNDAVAAGKITAETAAPLASAANDIKTCIASIQ
jgi:hypothetical protein